MSVHSVEVWNLLTRFLSTVYCLSLVSPTSASHRLVTWHQAFSQGTFTGPWGQSGCVVAPHGPLCGADCGWEAQGEEEILGTDPDLIEGEIEHQQRKAQADRMVQEAHRRRSALAPSTTTSQARNYTQHHSNLDELVGGSANRQRFSTNPDDVVVPLPRAGDRNSWMMPEETEQVDRISRFVGSARQYARAVPMKVHLPHHLPVSHPSRVGRSKSAQDGKPVTVDTVQDGPPLRV